MQLWELAISSCSSPIPARRRLLPKLLLCGDHQAYVADLAPEKGSLIWVLTASCVYIDLAVDAKTPAQNATA